MWLADPERPVGAPASRFGLQMVANQPATRLHSQLDFGALSQRSKIAGREPVRIHPADASQRNIDDGQVVRIYNERGSCLAGAVLSDAVMPGVVQLATGAWYQPVDLPGIGMTCIHGNPNILTRDEGTSRLAQACSGQLTWVEVEPYRGEAPSPVAHAAPLAAPADDQWIRRQLKQLRWQGA